MKHRFWKNQGAILFKDALRSDVVFYIETPLKKLLGSGRCFFAIS